MTVQILGTGCPKCRLLKASTEKAVDSLSGEVSTPIGVEDISDLDTMMEMGMLVSPGFAIDGELLSAGKVLSTEQIRGFVLKRLGEKP